MPTRKGEIDMELIRINDQKLKIMLTPSDMTQYELNAEHFGENSEEMHRAFRNLMEEVRRRTDFEFDERRLSVQYFPSKEGGCEMFVSGSRPRATEERKRNNTSKSTNALTVRNTKSYGGSFQKDGAYRFECMEDLLCACARLISVGFSGESSAYRDEQKHCFLLLRMRSHSPFAVPDEFQFLSEYGRIENPEILRLYFKEHGALICDRDAVRKLSALA